MDILESQEDILAKKKSELDAMGLMLRQKKLDLIKERESFLKEKSDFESYVKSVNDEKMTYDKLVKQQMDGIEKRNAELAIIDKEKARYINLSKSIDDKIKFIDKKEKEVYEKELSVSNREETLSKKLIEIAARESIINKRESDVNEKIRIASEKEMTNIKLASDLEIKERVIVSKEKSLKDVENAIKYKELKVEKLIKDKDLQKLIG